MMSLRINSFGMNALNALHMQSRSYPIHRIIAKRNQTSQVAQNSIDQYSRIFTQENDRVIVHAHIPSGKLSEKRMTLVKLYMYGNHLIGRENVPLLEISKLCNEREFKVKTHHLTTALESKANGNLFSFGKNEDLGRTVKLTEKGVNHSESLTASLMSDEVSEPAGRLRDVLLIFKNEDFSNGGLISTKMLAKTCLKYGYDVKFHHLRTLLLSQLAQQLFIFDRASDKVRLSPVGIEVIGHLKDQDANLKNPFSSM